MNTKNKKSAPASTDVRTHVRHIGTKHALIYGAVIFILAILQTTVFSRYRILSSVPELTLSAVVAIAFFENEYYASLFGLFGGLVVESLGYPGSFMLPLIYLLIGTGCALICKKVLSHSFASFGILSAAALLVRSMYWLAVCLFGSKQLSFIGVFLFSVMPEFIVSLALSPIIFLIIRTVHRILQKS